MPTNDTASVTAKPTRLEFIEAHQSGLMGGTYRISVTQTVAGDEPASGGHFSATFNTARTFAVQGPRFSLRPSDIFAVFPPEGSLGDHSNVLPHIALTRSTLPWERLADPSLVANADEPDNDPRPLPWLALLLFQDDESFSQVSTTVGELNNGDSYAARYPQSWGLEVGQLDSDPVNVIDVSRGLLETIMPSQQGLSYLSHVRQGTDDASNLVGEELAVVICPRLPAAGRTSIVHLVSLEGRLSGGAFDYQDELLGEGEDADDTLIRLVSLKSWRFTCTDPAQSFKGLLQNLDMEPSTLRRPLLEPADAAGVIQANEYLSEGYVSLMHRLRGGKRTFSWYRGPLVPGDNSAAPSSDWLALPARSSDELVHYNPATGLFDVSYAAAWQLGRLLALRSKAFSVGLYNWKRAHARLSKCAEQSQEYAHLALDDKLADACPLPAALASWLYDLSLLKGVPFNYLVPDPGMLPSESIRFFQLDPAWISCLLDGALSIGRSSPADHAYECDTLAAALPDLPYGAVSGLLLRSAVVSGWPTLLVDGYAGVHDNDNAVDDDDALLLLRMDRLSSAVLICLFDGATADTADANDTDPPRVVRTVDIHQKPEGLHFGVDVGVDDDGSPAHDLDGYPLYYKELRAADGTDPEDPALKVDPFPYNGVTRVVDVAVLPAKIEQALASASESGESGLGEFTSADFAMEMIEGVEDVRFLIAT